MNPKRGLFAEKTILVSGGSLRNKRKGRFARPLATRESMHFVLRSSQAKGEWSFRRAENRKRIEGILKKFSEKYGAKILSSANVGNHLHLHLQLGNRLFYRPFIRAITGAIALAVTNANRWRKLTKRFWDYRPFSRVVRGWKAKLTLRDYIELNQLEGMGCSREAARNKIAAKWRGMG